MLQRSVNICKTLNLKKCIFGTSRISHLCHKRDEDGVRLDDSKCFQFSKFWLPKTSESSDRHRAQRSICLHSCTFTADILQPLASMLSTKNNFLWDRTQQWKDIRSTHPVLVIFDPTKARFMSRDTSAYRVGAALKQLQSNGKLQVILRVACTLTETEQWYMQIEKEALAVVWDCEKFRDDFIRTKFTLERPQTIGNSVLHQVTGWLYSRSAKVSHANNAPFLWHCPHSQQRVPRHRHSVKSIPLNDRAVWLENLCTRHHVHYTSNCISAWRHWNTVSNWSRL